jgi:hypothetical protein
MLFEFTEVLPVVFEGRSQHKVAPVLGVRLFPDRKRNVDCLVDVHWEIFELLGNSALVRHKLDRRVFRVYVAEAHLLVNVCRQGVGELRQDVPEVMISVIINYQVLLDHIFAQGVLRQHAQESPHQDLVWLPFEHLLKRDLFETTCVPRVMPVDFLLSLSAGQERIMHVNDDALVTVFEVILFITWLVLTADELRNQDRHATERHSLCVEEMVSCPLVVDGDVLAGGLGSRHVTVHEVVLQMVRHFGHTMSDFRVELDLSHFLLWNELFQVFSRHPRQTVWLGLVFFFGAKA